MDKFNKICLIAIVAVVLTFLVIGYVSYQVGGNEATDDKVNDKAGGGTIYNPFTVENWGENGEYFGFTTVGCVGGLIAGYIFPTLFSKTQTGREN